ncbi:trigger factor [Advenella kashmirensis W13003]|uniref:Trigger factor n=1 Tax=Advenella kashmirensis W13003 TaxID=1424334 RepID=V8QQ71_9BURK|nr:trigger factor [Advenella kashmirensis]ETF02096.1 trigger factor [Advenella kashmirensis W13003]
MQPTVETLEGLERKVNLVISIEDVEKDVKTQLQRVARTAKVQGFRPGKAPVSVIERSHGPGIRYDVINQKVGQLFDEAVREAKLRVAGAPSIEPNEDSTDGQLSFAAKFEVYPEVSVPDLSALEVTRFAADVGEQEVSNTIDILRKQRATFSADAERAAQKDDRVTVDFVGKIDDVEFDGGKAEDFPFQLGQGRMLPEFEEAATGLKAGESKTFSLTFPEDYPGKDVAGKTAEFTITVKEVAVPVLPEVDSEFAKSLGQSEGDTEKLLAEVRSNIEREVKNRTQARTKNSVMDALAKSATFDVPKSLVDNDVQSRIAAAREDLKQRGMPNADTMDIPADAFQSESERRVRLGLIVAELVDSAKLQVTPEQVRTRIEEFAQNYEKPEQVITYYLTDRQRRAEIESVVLEDNVVDHILSKAKVTDEKVPFEELMGTV